MNFVNGLRLLLVGGLTTTVASGQSWNTPTYTKSVALQSADEVEWDFSSWKWVDPNGVTHSFPGYAVWDKQIINRRAYISENNLSNVQSSDGSTIYLTTNMTTAGAVTGQVTNVVQASANFIVLGVLYAPPGCSSTTGSGYISYSSSNMVGSSHNTSESFSKGISYSQDISFGVSAGSDMKVEGGLSGSWSYSKDIKDSQSQSVTTTITSADQITNPADGLNHDFDVIAVWLNPLMKYTMPAQNQVLQAIQPDPNYSNFMNSLGYAFPVNLMDVAYFKVGELRNQIWLASQPAGTDPSSGPGIVMSTGNITETQRPWAQAYYGGAQALSVSDLQMILNRDPFNDPNNQPKVADLNALKGLDGQNAQNRFVWVSNSAYNPSQTITYSDTYTDSSSTTSNVVDTYSTSWTVHGGASCWFLGAGQSVTTSLTWKNEHSNTSSNQQTFTTNAQIKGPSSDWHGPFSSVAIYRDTLYNTYLFVPVIE